MKRPISFFLLVIGLSLALIRCSSNTAETVFVQSPLPFEENALEPFMSARTLSFHYGMHHAAYVKNANTLAKESPFKGKTPEEIIQRTAGKAEYQALFNQAAQAWNHSFFWKCLKPQGGGLPTGELLHRIESSFGSFDQFKREFMTASGGVFGSGWVWLAQDKDALVILTTPNADTPLAHGLWPLFTVDVWEHAYYLDYQNKRTDFVGAVFEHMANWDYAASLLDGQTTGH